MSTVGWVAVILSVIAVILSAVAVAGPGIPFYARRRRSRLAQLTAPEADAPQQLVVVGRRQGYRDCTTCGRPRAVWRVPDPDAPDKDVLVAVRCPGCGSDEP